MGPEPPAEQNSQTGASDYLPSLARLGRHLEADDLNMVEVDEAGSFVSPCVGAQSVPRVAQ
eukprot:457370-Alexandrium_andersonii.AAC.1